jgi:uncharacterized membrane protein
MSRLIAALIAACFAFGAVPSYAQTSSTPADQQKMDKKEQKAQKKANKKAKKDQKKADKQAKKNAKKAQKDAEKDAK